nr:hypothetical protein [Tanacetum cinerariifolium]
MDMTINQQVALDEAIVSHASILRIGKSNFRLKSDISSKESTLQLASLFFKAFLVTADVPEIYMQEFWATAYVHQHTIRFKINNKKHIVSLESFREMLHICPRIHGQSFDELPFEEEILDFIRFLRHSATIRTLTDVNINKLYQPWRSFAAIINKCLTGKSFGYDRTPRHTKNTMLLPLEKQYLSQRLVPEGKRSGYDNSITPPTATTTLKPIVAVTLRLNAAAKGKQTAKSLSAPSEVARIEAQQLKIVLRRSRQQTHISQPGGSGTYEGTGLKPGVPDVDDDDEGDKGNDREEREKDDEEEEKDGDERDNDDEDQEVAKNDDQDDVKGSEDDDEVSESDEEVDDEETRVEESFDPIPRTPKSSEDEGDGEQNQGLNVNEEEEHIEEGEEDELYRDININQGKGFRSDSMFRFDDRLKSLEANFFEFRQTNPFAEAVSVIPGIVHQYMNQQINEASVNAQLEAEVLTRSSHSSGTSYAVAADLLEMELKKILIEKMEGNKHDDDDDDDKDKGPSAGSDRGSKRRREGKKHESASAPLETATRSAGRSTTGSKSRQASASESAFAEEPLEYHLEEVYKATTDQLDWVNPEGQQYPHNLLQPLPLIPDNRVTKTKAADYGHIKWIEDLLPMMMWIHEPIDYDKHALWGVSHWGRKRQQFYGFTVNWESARDVYSKRRIIVVTDLKIVEWHSYKHLD